MRKFTMFFVLAAVALTIGIAKAQTGMIAYSVSDVQLTSTPNVYTASTTAALDQNGKFYELKHADSLTITTTGCTHVPKSGATGIVLIKPSGRIIQFSDGPTCTISDIR